MKQFIILLFILVPTSVYSQSSWGIGVNLVPLWKSSPDIYKHVWDTENNSITGKEFRIGIIRGSDGGGDWGVYFVRNTFEVEQMFPFEPAPSIHGDLLLFCRGVPSDVLENLGGLSIGCNQRDSEFKASGTAIMHGVKIEKFTSYVTLWDRMQIGVLYGTGIGAYEDLEIEEIQYQTEVDVGYPLSKPVLRSQVVTSEVGDIKDYYRTKYVVIGSLEAAVAFRVVKGLKVRVSGGLNFPNTQILSLGVNYLF